MVPSPRPRKCWAASTSSKRGTWRRPWRSRLTSPGPAPGALRFAQCGTLARCASVSARVPRPRQWRGSASGLLSYVVAQHHAPRGRLDSHLASLSPKLPSVVDRHAVLALPLVHHLVQQGVQRLFPAMSPDVSATDGDLRGATARAWRAVLTEAVPHAAGDADRDR